MRATAIRNNKGMTLVEVLVALLISLLVFLALMQTALVSIDANMRNVLRDEAVRIADIRMNTARGLPYEQITSDGGSLSGCSSFCPTGFPATGRCPTLGEGTLRPIRSLNMETDFNYCTNQTCAELDAGSDGDCSTDDAEIKQVNITVGWKWKGEDYRHSIQTIRRRL